jgi:hypothetical protein
MSYSNGSTDVYASNGNGYTHGHSNGGSYSSDMSYSNGQSEVTKYKRGQADSSTVDVETLIKTLKESFDCSYPDKDPLGPICDKPLPFPKATPELIRWTHTFVEQISYKYSTEVKVSFLSLTHSSSLLFSFSFPPCLSFPIHCYTPNHLGGIQSNA